MPQTSEYAPASWWSPRYRYIYIYIDIWYPDILYTVGHCIRSRVPIITSSLSLLPFSVWSLFCLFSKPVQLALSSFSGGIALYVDIDSLCQGKVSSGLPVTPSWTDPFHLLSIRATSLSLERLLKLGMRGRWYVKCPNMTRPFRKSWRMKIAVGLAPQAV